MDLCNGRFQVVWKLFRKQDGYLYLRAADGEGMAKMWHLLLQTQSIKSMLQTFYSQTASSKIQTKKGSKESIEKSYCSCLLKNIINLKLGQTSASQKW